MAMIEQLSPRLREALTRRAVPYASGAATLLIVLLMGLNSISLHFTTDYGDLLLPAAVGAPTMLPGLRFSALGQQSGSTVLCDDFAAVVMVMIVVAVLGRHVRTHPNSSRIHRLLTAWGALVLAGFLAGFFRGLVVARLVAGGPLAYFGYPALGALFGAGWSLLLGWFPGAAVLAAAGDGRYRRALARRWATTGGPLVSRGWAAASTAVGAGAAATAATAARVRQRAVAPDPASEPAAGSGVAGSGVSGSGSGVAASASVAPPVDPVDSPVTAAPADPAAFATSPDVSKTPPAFAKPTSSDAPPLPTAAQIPPMPTVPPLLPKPSSPPSSAASALTAAAVGARLLVVARTVLRRVGIMLGHLLADCRWGWAVLVERLRPLGRRAARWSRRVWARAVREARLLRQIRFDELREVRSLGELRALRHSRGEKHQASRITTP